MHIYTSAVLVALCSASLLAGCKGDPTSKPTQPPAPTVETTPPTDEDPADVVVTPMPDVQVTALVDAGTQATAASAPADTTAVTTLAPLVPGIIKGERLAAWNAYRAEPVEPKDFPSTLTRAVKCAGETVGEDEDDVCSTPLPSVIGLRKDGAVALLGSAPMGSCNDVPASMTGIIAMLPSLRAGATINLPKTPMSEDDAIDDPEAAIDQIGKAVWGWAKRLPAAGFEPASTLLKGTLLEERGIRMVEASALLTAPLAGWMLDTVAGKDAITVRLVSPDNQRELKVGVIPHISGECAADEREDGSCGDYDAANLGDLVISLDQKHFIATVAMSDGSHCGIDLTQHFAWPVPAGLPLAP